MPKKKKKNMQYKTKILSRSYIKITLSLSRLIIFLTEKAPHELLSRPQTVQNRQTMKISHHMVSKKFNKLLNPV